MPAPDSNLYGTYVTGNIPWKSQQHHEIAQKAQKIFAQPFKKVPSKVARPNEYNDLVDRHLLNLMGVDPEVAKNEKKKIRLRSEIRAYVNLLSPEEKAEYFKNSKTGITESELYNPELDIFNPPVSEANNESYNLAKKEIKGSMNKDYLKPMLSKIEGTTNPLFSSENAATLKQFENHYGEMGKSVLQEMSENYLRNIVPNVDYNFMKAGLWNSPLRGHQQNLVLSELGKNAMNNLTKLKAQGFEKGVEHISQSKQHNLAANQLAANVIRGEKEDANVAAKNLVKIDESNLTADMAKTEALRQAAADKQKNENATLEETQRHAIAEQEHDRRMIEREATIASGLPSNIDMPGYKMAETSPNYAQLAGGALGTLSGLGNLFAAKKAGGLVGKYAPGGFVLPNFPITPEMQQHEAEVREIHNNNHMGDPRWHAVAQMGSALLENHGKMSPAQALGVGSKNALDTYAKHKEAQQLQRERGINLMQQIQASRMKQQEVMADYDRHMKTLHETTRHNKAIEGHNAETLNATRSFGTAPSDEGGRMKYLPKGIKETAESRERAKNNRKIRDQFVNQKSNYQKALEDADKLNELIHSSQMDTGATTNLISKIPGIGPHIAALLGAGTQTEQNEFDKLSQDFVNAESAALGGAATDAQRAAIAAAKTRRDITTPANYEILNKTMIPTLRNKISKADFIEDFVQSGKGDEQDALVAYKDNLEPNVYVPKGGKSSETKTTPKIANSSKSSDQQGALAELKRRGLVNG